MQFFVKDVFPQFCGRKTDLYDTGTDSDGIVNTVQNQACKGHLELTILSFLKRIVGFLRSLAIDGDLSGLGDH